MVFGGCCPNGAHPGDALLPATATVHVLDVGALAWTSHAVADHAAPGRLAGPARLGCAGGAQEQLRTTAPGSRTGHITTVRAQGLSLGLTKACR